MKPGESTAATGRGGRRPGAGRPRDAELDESILECALDSLETRGYQSLTINEVAERAGVAKATLYRRWPSKAALVSAAIDRLSLDVTEVPDTGDLASDLARVIQVAYDLVLRGRGKILTNLVGNSGNDPEVRDLIRMIILSRRRGYYQVLDRAIERGVLPRDLDQELVIDMLIGPLWTRLLITASPVPDGLVSSLVGTVLHGLLGRPPRVPARPRRVRRSA